MSSIGENIKRIRIEKGLTQKQLGNLCTPPMADSAIRRYENGNANPKLETLHKIADALGVYLSDLEPDWGEFSTDEIVRDMSEMVRSSTKNSEKTLDNLIKTFQNIRTIKKPTKDELLIYHYSHLNDTGKSEAIRQVEMLTKIPEYRQSDTITQVLNSAHECTDIEVTEEMRKHDDDIMMDDLEWE